MADPPSIPISEFKSRCLAILDEVGRTGKSVRITKRGKPVADVVPPGSLQRPKKWLGSMRGTGQIIGDLVAPIGEPSDWEALRS